MVQENHGEAAGKAKGRLPSTMKLHGRGQFTAHFWASVPPLESRAVPLPLRKDRKEMTLQTSTEFGLQECL